jgi:hypothetical protein
MPIKEAIKYLAGSLALGLITGIIIVYRLVELNKKNEYKRFANEISE